jgi:hypothetical protein
MYSRYVSPLCGIAVAALVALTNSVASQTQQKSASELIAGSWTLMIADSVRTDGTLSKSCPARAISQVLALPAPIRWTRLARR